ncbi:uncharacterized protein LOC110454646 [Mizuhopecten yessoensis]|uniref:Calcium-binding protein CML8 n=1 Tax=Mizuhopecten yessoensis TaxID=6573 RepID=A0A210QER9_MIZYE|nr:uncharacterized protein LOC110454646 [Mizuhopecten yessoensis]OWF47208.1 calcium-binding protein CML8 [Mizuhopecten yessoensis]
MSEDQGREIFAYVRERDDARAKLKKVEDELQEYQSKLYDANSKIESLKKSLAHAQKATAAGQKGAPAKAAPAGAAKGKGPAAKGGGDKAKAKASSTSTPNDTPAPTPPPARQPTTVRHPPILGKEQLSEDTYEYYNAIGDLFPALPLAIVLTAEKKFNLADVNGDGVVDKEEIDSVLSTSDVAMFTPKQIEEIIKEIDKDETGDLDFCEVLTVLEKMGRRRNSKLPDAINDNKEKVCAIQ